jgi:hypothetical protein
VLVMCRFVLSVMLICGVCVCLVFVLGVRRVSRLMVLVV